MTDIADTTPAAETTSALTYVAFSDLAVAPENPRASEGPDAGIARLADTIHAVGVLYPLLVRPGTRKGEKPSMALDGRRRILALEVLLEAGAITADYKVPVITSNDKATRVAAAIVANEERLPIHVADVIVAIGKLRKQRYTIADIATALAYDETEIRRLQALSELDRTAIRALRENCITLRQARRLARIPDKAAQRQLAEHALSFQQLGDHQIEAIDSDRVDVHDPRLALVGLDRYRAAGGRMEGDLFGELPDVLRDVEILQDLWRAQAEPVVQALKTEGLTVFIASARCYTAPEGFSRPPYVYRPQLTDTARDALTTAQAAAREAAGALRARDLTSDASAGLIAVALKAQRDQEAAPLTSGRIGAVTLFPDDTSGIAAEFFMASVETIESEEGEGDASELGDEDDTSSLSDRRFGLVEVPQADVDVEGRSHVLHETQTDVATRGLVRDLADNPAVALTAVIAQLFKDLVLHDGSTDGSALRVRSEAYSRVGSQPIPALDGEVRLRLDRRKQAYRASGLRPIPWVETLPFGERTALLAELAGLSLNLREARTSTIRHGARAEAAELAELCASDISQHWTPDAAYLAVHSKKQLTGLLQEMGCDDPRAAALKKDELVTFVAEAAAERLFAPKALSWTAPTPVAGDDPANEAPEFDEPEEQDEGAATDLPADGVIVPFPSGEVGHQAAA